MISIIINVDTRSENDAEGGMSKGVVSRDFLDAGVFNKIKFFDGFEKEVILFIDKHEEISQTILDYVHSICNVVCVRKNTQESHFRDKNYLEALSLARGEIVVHFDQDTAAFTSSPEPIRQMINWLEDYDYVSYPSHWSPKAVHDDTFDHDWASTRFFMCKKETLDFTELKWMMQDYNGCYEKYPANRKCFWTEHWLGLIARSKGRKILYPKIELDKYAIFSWGSYEKWTLRRLNELPYEEVKQFINSHNGIQYPNDVFV